MNNDSEEKIDTFMYKVKNLLHESFGEETNHGTAYAVAGVLVGLAVGYYSRYVPRVTAVDNIIKLMTKYRGEPVANPNSDKSVN